jgi:sugar fermentation stimulation protein A
MRLRRAVPPLVDRVRGDAPDRAAIGQRSQAVYLKGGISLPFLLRSTFVDRPHRFLVHARLDGEIVAAACGDPGRLVGLLRPGVPLLLQPCDGRGRRTRYTAVLARQRRSWVSVLPVLANRLFAEALAAGAIPGLGGWTLVQREVRHGASRFDFLLRDRDGKAVLTEVKSVTLVEGRRALFPDAPTARGVRHVRELIAHRRGGGRALLAFVVQRDDADSVSPHAVIDPELAAALAEARRAGVRLAAYACRMTTSGGRLAREIPVVTP